MTKREFLDTVFALAPNEANKIMDAFDEYVESAQLSTNFAKVDTDLISRAKAIDGKICIRRANGVEIYDDYAVPVEYLKQLPPEQPERIRGRWIIRETSSGDTEARCSHCGFTTLVDEPGNGLHMVSDLNFCPNCGADMREVTI